MPSVPDELRPPLGHAEFHVLLAVGGGEMHGYAIMREIERQTGGRLRVGPGTLYGSLKRMVSAGWIEESDGPVGPVDLRGPREERRRAYRLTRLGKRVAEAEAVRLEELVNVARARKLLPRRA
jgi:DNA-binding PadR family transcriptional regulator